MAVGHEIDYHRRVTEWLEEHFCPLPSFEDSRVAARVAGYRSYLIHHRERMRELLQNVILAVAVLVNVAVTVFHNDITTRRCYDVWEQVAITALSWVMVLLTGLNFCVCLYLKGYTFKLHGPIVRCVVCSFTDLREGGAAGT